MEKKVESQSQQTIPVAWQQHEDLAACMGELYEKSLWTDVKFHCKNHEESVILHAHKIVLAARSPVFQAMFFGSCADGKEDIEFDHAEAKVLDLVLRYLYTDTTNLDEYSAPSVLKVAHCYQVNKLVQFCANYLATNLTTENACTIFSLSMLYQLTSLRDTCCSFIDKNAQKILHSKGFRELPEEHMLYIVKGDTFFAKEDIIFKTAEEWAAQKLRQKNLETSGPNIRKAPGEAFYYLRLPTMSYTTFKECVRRKGYISVDEYEDITDFINDVPISSVQSNSCVPRIPAEETLTLNDEKGNTITTDRISSSFQITVTRNLKLSHFTLANVQQFMQYYEMLFKKTNTKRVNITERNVHDLFLSYIGEVIKVETRQSISNLEQADGATLSNKLEIAISGHFEITCGNKEKKQDKEQEPSTAGGAAYKAVDNIKLILAEDFEVLSSQISTRIIDLKKHVVLTNAESPYTFTLTLRYSCDSNVKMKTNCSSSIGTITSKNKQLQVKHMAGRFAGIRSLGFENISRHETV